MLNSTQSHAWLDPYLPFSRFRSRENRNFCRLLNKNKKNVVRVSVFNISTGTMRNLIHLYDMYLNFRELLLMNKCFLHSTQVEESILISIPWISERNGYPHGHPCYQGYPLDYTAKKVLIKGAWGVLHYFDMYAMGWGSYTKCHWEKTLPGERLKPGWPSCQYNAHPLRYFAAG